MQYLHDEMLLLSLSKALSLIYVDEIFASATHLEMCIFTGGTNEEFEVCLNFSDHHHYGCILVV